MHLSRGSCCHSRGPLIRFNKFQNLDLLEPHNLVPPGVFTLDGLLRYGEDHKQCPYFSARRMVCCMLRLHATFILY